MFQSNLNWLFFFLFYTLFPNSLNDIFELYFFRNVYSDTFVDKTFYKQASFNGHCVGWFSQCPWRLSFYLPYLLSKVNVEVSKLYGFPFLYPFLSILLHVFWIVMARCMHTTSQYPQWVLILASHHGFPSFT